jgi:phosphoglycolate phosphatase-like HAD superfamily hydrolase
VLPHSEDSAGGTERGLPPTSSSSEGEEFDSHRGRILKERYLNQVTAFPKVRELFEALEQNGIETLLASSAKKGELEVYKKTRSHR